MARKLYPDECPAFEVIDGHDHYGGRMFGEVFEGFWDPEYPHGIELQTGSSAHLFFFRSALRPLTPAARAMLALTTSW